MAKRGKYAPIYLSADDGQGLSGLMRKASRVEKDLSIIVRVLGKDKVADASREYVEKPQPKVPGRRR